MSNRQASNPLSEATDGDAIEPSGRGTNEQMLETEPPISTAQKRKRYVSKACVECKKRKVRCSGEQPCDQCLAGRLKCSYSAETRRRTQWTGTGESRSDNTAVHTGAQRSDLVEDTFKSDVIDRLQSILGELRAVSESVNVSTSEAKLGSLAASLQSLVTPESAEVLEQHANDANPDKNIFMGGPSILKPWKTLEKRIEGAGDGSPSAAVANSSTANANSSTAKQDCLLSVCPSVAACYVHEIRFWDANVRHHGISILRDSIKVYFSLLNPHYPCLDEDEFQQRFVRLEPGTDNHEITLERVQTIALTYSITAVVKFVKDFCAEDNITLGWYEFTRAEHLLNHVVRTGKANLATIQCLILKASYLLHIERHDWAYDVMGTAVRLCFQLGIHNQQSWTDVSAFEKHMRARIFWCVYCLERNISHHCGAPYQINDKDIAIELPTEMTEGQRGSVAGEDSISPIANQLATIRWAGLCSDMWDSMFGVNARPVTPELIAVTDARILLLLDEIPESLKWQSSIVDDVELLQHSHHVVRQSIVLHLRVNHLRLLLRRGDLMDAKTGGRTAKLCVEIAASSVDSMFKYHKSPLREATARFPTVSYLSGAIVVVTAVILAKKVDNDCWQKACETFRKAMFLLEDIAPGFVLARRLLRRFRTVIDATTQAMSKNPLTAKSPGRLSQVQGPGPVDLESIPAEPVPAQNHTMFDMNFQYLAQFEPLSMLDNDQNMFPFSTIAQTAGL